MKEILQRVLAGDRDAYRLVVREYGPLVRACLAAPLSAVDAVEDLAQETFIAAYEQLADFDLSQDFAPWIRGIARNKLLMHLRRLHQHGAALEKLKARAAQEVFEQVARAQERDDARVLDRLRACVEKLPRRLGEALRARYFERESVAAIAGRQRTSVGAVSSLLFRGRKELETCLGRTE
jgi:RNA polymerase sigma-70 factor (ECF subfamily)